MQIPLRNPVPVREEITNKEKNESILGLGGSSGVPEFEETGDEILAVAQEVFTCPKTHKQYKIR